MKWGHLNSWKAFQIKQVIDSPWFLSGERALIVGDQSRECQVRNTASRKDSLVKIVFGKLIAFDESLLLGRACYFRPRQTGMVNRFQKPRPTRCLSFILQHIKDVWWHRLIKDLESPGVITRLNTC